MKFTVAPELFEVLDDACFGVLAVKGLDNGRSGTEFADLLAAAVSQAEKDFENVRIKEAPQTAPYRAAFQSLGINPNKFMCSIEALLSRVAKKKGLPSINPAVDLGNAVSLKYRIPLGAHDLDTMQGDIELRPARPGDSFVPFGGGEAEVPDAGEMVYVSGQTVRTRRWTWRQSEIGKITAASSSIFFPLDGFTNFNRAQTLAARDELAGLLQSYWPCRVLTGLVDREHPEVEIDF